MGIVHRRVFIGKVGKAEEIVTVLQEGDKLLQQYGGDFKSRILTDYMSGRTDRVVAEWEVNDLNAIDSAMERVVSDPPGTGGIQDLDGEVGRAYTLCPR